MLHKSLLAGQNYQDTSDYNVVWSKIRHLIEEVFGIFCSSGQIFTLSGLVVCLWLTLCRAALACLQLICRHSHSIAVEKKRINSALLGLGWPSGRMLFAGRICHFCQHSSSILLANPYTYTVLHTLHKQKTIRRYTKQ